MRNAGSPAYRKNTRQRHDQHDRLHCFGNPVVTSCRANTYPWLAPSPAFQPFVWVLLALAEHVTSQIDDFRSRQRTANCDICPTKSKRKTKKPKPKQALRVFAWGEMDWACKRLLLKSNKFRTRTIYRKRRGQQGVREDQPKVRQPVEIAIGSQVISIIINERTPCRIRHDSEGLTCVGCARASPFFQERDGMEEYGTRSSIRQTTRGGARRRRKGREK